MSDPTDPGGVGRRPARARAARVGDTGSPLATPVTIGLAILLVLGGFFILRSVRDDTTFAGGSAPVVDNPPTLGGEEGGETPTGSVTPDQAPESTAAPTPAAPVRTGATVQVANASRIPQSAGAMTSTLATAGYTTAEATDVNREIVGEAVFTDSKIYYVATDTAAAAVAQQLATDLAVPAANVQPMPDPIPTSSGDLGNATVLMLLGTAQAGKTIAPAAGIAATGAAPSDGGQSLLPPVPGGNTTG